MLAFSVSLAFVAGLIGSAPLTITAGPSQQFPDINAALAWLKHKILAYPVTIQCVSHTVPATITITGLASPSMISIVGSIGNPSLVTLTGPSTGGDLFVFQNPGCSGVTIGWLTLTSQVGGNNYALNLHFTSPAVYAIPNSMIFTGTWVYAVFMSGLSSLDMQGCNANIIGNFAAVSHTAHLHISSSTITGTSSYNAFDVAFGGSIEGYYVTASGWANGVICSYFGVFETGGTSPSLTFNSCASTNHN